MFQSNKEYFEFLKQSGVHSFLQETPNNHLTNKHIQTKSPKNKDFKSLNEITEISDLIPLIINHNTTARIQEAHIFLGHFIVEQVENKLFKVKENLIR